MRLAKGINLDHYFLAQPCQFLVPLLCKLLKFVSIEVFNLGGLLLVFLDHIVFYFDLSPLTDILYIQQLHLSYPIIVILGMRKSVVVELGSKMEEIHR